MALGCGGAPYLSYLLCRSFSIWGSTVVHRSSFHRELERQLAMTPSDGPAHPALLPLPLEATYAFWLTMFRRSTTTDRSLMATAESTDVCRQAPLRGQHGMGVGRLEARDCANKEGKAQPDGSAQVPGAGRCNRAALPGHRSLCSA